MANPTIGRVACEFCGGPARVTECKKKNDHTPPNLCITCEDGCEQRFTRNAAATAKVRAKMKPATDPTPATTPKEKPKDDQPKKPAAGGQQPAGKQPATDAGKQPERRRGFGILGR